MFVVFCMHMYSFADLIRRTPLPTFSDTAITDRHSDTSIFQLRVHWVQISWSTGSEKSFGHVPPVGVEPSTSCLQSEHPIHWARLSTLSNLLLLCSHSPNGFHPRTSAECIHSSGMGTVRPSNTLSNTLVNSVYN